MELLYYIVKGGMSTEKGNSSIGESIFTSDTFLPIGVGGDFEGPYKSLSDLKSYSTFYKKLEERDSRKAFKIVQQKNINNLQGLLLIPEGTTFNIDFIMGYVHSIFGEFKGEEAKGSHFFNEKNTKIKRIINTNSKGVILADIEKFDSDKQQWFEKKNTTLFPLSWNQGTILQQLYYANENKKLKDETKSLYVATTPSGIIVEFVIVNNIIKTVYPLL